MRSLCIAGILFAHSAQVALPSPEAARARAAQEPLLMAEEVFNGTVVSVEDGDSLVVRTQSERKTLHVAGIDAPELSQPGGPEAKAFLSDFALGKSVTVRLPNPSERSARLEIGGADVSAALIRAGMAWHCPRYADDRDLTAAETDARSSKRGLWKQTRPTPPWLHRGAGACWQDKGGGSARDDPPDFSGTWTAVRPAERAGQKLIIRQDAAILTIEGPPERGAFAVAYRLDGPTSVALVTPDGPVDIVAKTRWHGGALIVEERRWMVRGEEATYVRQALWVDAGGLLNYEVSTPRPIGQQDSTTLVLARDAPRPPDRSDPPAGR